jgi:DNA-binding response OmpR family regulator
MPVLSGLELLGEIRTKLPEVKTPILILTSEAELQSVKIAKGYGVAAWIVKPFTTDILIKTVSRLLNGNSNEK